MSKKYYKVVNSNTRSSARFGGVYYKLNRWTEAPDNTRLFVFDSLEKAKSFCSYDEEIYECQIIGGVRGYGCRTLIDILPFWTTFNNVLKKKKGFKREFFDFKLADTQAILAKKVKLLRKVRY